MNVRKQDLDVISPILVTFTIKQTSGVDDLKDANIGEPVIISADGETGPISDGEQLLGKLVGLTLTDKDDGDRLATVQIGGVCRLAIGTTFPVAGNRVIGAAGAKVKQAPTVASDPAGGNIARGTGLSVNGTTDCMILLN